MRNKKDVELKILVALLYFLGLSLRKASSIDIWEDKSRVNYYHKLKKVLKQPRKKERKLIAIDETKIKLEKKLIFVWAAIDVDTKECLAVWASESRGSFEAYVFLKEVLKYCENKPEIVVDSIYTKAWFKIQTFGDRNAVEGFFSRKGQRDFGIYFRSEVPLISFKAG